MGGSHTQDLNQKVVQRYGWSARFEKEPFDNSSNDVNSSRSYWVAYVTVGLNDERKFVSDNHVSPADTMDGKKTGIASASKAALEGLNEEIARQEAKPKKELTQVFPLYPAGKQGDNRQKPLFLIKGSSQRNWDQFIWDHKPAVVGIDTEGNQCSPPILVQIATADAVLLEITSMLDNQLSENLKRLLADNTIVKVFCDNFAHHDKKSLGIHRHDHTGSHEADYSQGPVVDLEALASAILGPTKVPRGLSRIVTLVMPELNVIIGKPPPSKGERFKDICRFAKIEQGKAPPITSFRDLSHKDRFYAAMDAWATLLAYNRITLATAASTRQ
jgi:3'-5' exonuclease